MLGLRNWASAGFEPCTRWPGPTPDPLGHGAQTQMKGRLFGENACVSLKKQRFLKPTPFWGFQPWKPQKRVGLRNWWEKISQTYPFLKVSTLKTSKKGRFEKLGFSGIRTLHPLARTNTRSVRLRGPNSNLQGRLFEENARECGSLVVWRNKDFSNLPLFEAFNL